MRAIPTQLLALAGQVLKTNHVDCGKSKKGQKSNAVLGYARMLQASLRKPALVPLLCFPMAPSLITGPSSVISGGGCAGKSQIQLDDDAGVQPKSWSASEVK